jgi:hypothetical protein
MFTRIIHPQNDQDVNCVPKPETVLFPQISGWPASASSGPALPADAVPLALSALGAAPG